MLVDGGWDPEFARACIAAHNGEPFGDLVGYEPPEPEDGSA